MSEPEPGLQALSCLGQRATSPAGEALFAALNTLYRPELPEDEPDRYHAWVLVRRLGLELGFTDSEYQAAAPRHRWRHGELVLTQVYFYSDRDDIRPYRGPLPYGLAFGDDRAQTREKLAAVEGTRHSWLTDTWDVDGYRLNVVYAADSQGIARLACRVMPAPIERKRPASRPRLAEVVDLLGEPIDSPALTTLWGAVIDAGRRRAAIEDGEIDLLATHGATIEFATDCAAGPGVRSVTLYRNRDRESAGWEGELPLGLVFDDSPEALFSKIAIKPAQHADSALTGYVVWERERFTLHVLYSNVDNRLLRIRLLAPGQWAPIRLMG